MFNFLSLFRLDLSFAFGFKGASRKEIIKRIALMALICVCFAVPLFFVFAILYFGAQLSVVYGGLAEIINIVFFAMQLMMIAIFLPSYVSVLFFSKDNELLASLPIGKSAIFSSRMLTMYLQMSAVSADYFDCRYRDGVRRVGGRIRSGSGILDFIAVRINNDTYNSAFAYYAHFLSGNEVRISVQSQFYAQVRFDITVVRRNNGADILRCGIISKLCQQYRFFFRFDV